MAAARFPKSPKPTSKLSAAEYTVVFTGIAGSGKSAVCNFLMQNEIFQSKCSFEPVTSTAPSEMVLIEGKYITLVDTPEFFLNPSSREIGYYERFEVAKGLIKIMSGFHVLGLVLKLPHRISEEVMKLFKNLLYKYEHYLPYTVLFFTNGKVLGETEDEQRTELEYMIKAVKGNHMNHFSQLLERINYRYIILESVAPMEQGYHAKKSKELVTMIDTIFKQTRKLATNDFALSMAENLMKVKIDQTKLFEELADRIRIAQKVMRTEKSTEKSDFYAYLLSVIIFGGGTLAALLPQDAEQVGHNVLSTTGTCTFQ